MAGRGSGPAKMPAPFEQFGNERGALSERHLPVTEMRVHRGKTKKLGAGRKQPSGSSLDFFRIQIYRHLRAQCFWRISTEPTKRIIKDYEEQGRAAPTMEPPRRVVDRATLTPEKRAEVITPWRDQDAWSKVAKRPDSASAERKATMLRESISTGQKSKPAPVSVRATKSRKDRGEGEGHAVVVAPWRHDDAWRSVRDPSVPEPCQWRRSLTTLRLKRHGV